MSQSLVQGADARRRKVRKGTHSCWECRRRKIRCQYASPDDAVCIGCRARGSACRSQEFTDESPPSQQAPERKVSQRLDRLEHMMERLMSHVLRAPPSSASGREEGARRMSTDDDAAGHRSKSSGPQRSVSPVVSDSGESPTRRGTRHRVTGEHDEIPENVDEIYGDPVHVVAHVCPTAAAKQGYGNVDVLDTSTADDTPVAALLGIQDSLSNGVTTTTAFSPKSMETSANSASSPANNGGGTGSVGASAGVLGEINGETGESTLGSSSTAGGTETANTSTISRPSELYFSEWSRLRQLSKLLHSMFPVQDDINIIAGSAPAQFVATLFHSKHDIAEGRGEPASNLTVIPPIASHPAVLARRLLQLTLCMQQMAPCFILQHKLHMVEPLSEVISRIAGVVSHTVTSNDDLIGSVEGLESIVLLGLQQSNAGQLRKAWLSYRRAMSLAQLMGLDRGNTRALKSCDPAADPRHRPTPEAIWYRINASDRHVSLLLGLRAGCQDDEFYGGGSSSGAPGGQVGASYPFEADTDTPQEKLGKAHTALTGRIIARNHSRASLEHTYSVTQAIDADLRAAAARGLDPTWWAVPKFDPYARPDFIFDEIERSILQVHHHCILILLHLPYMLRGDNPASTAAKLMGASEHSAGRCAAHEARSPGEPLPQEPSDCSSGLASSDCNNGLAYSKTTCMRSSRAVLERFIRFRLLISSAFSCRHVDYASLIAAMTLIIGYLGPRPAAGTGVNVLEVFDSQLQKDRAMVEEVRNRMQHIGQINNDKLSRESAATIQQLLPVLDLVSRKPEASSPSASTTVPANINAVSDDYDPGLNNGESGLSCPPDGACPPVGTPPSAVRLNVPYFGTVNIHANPATGMAGIPSHQHEHLQQQPSQQPQMPPFAGASHSPYNMFTPGSAATGPSVLDWHGNSPSALTMHGSSGLQQQDPATDLNAMLVDFDPMPIGDDIGQRQQNQASSDGLYGFGATAPFPDMTGASDDWAMQGVDTTYWSLLNGSGGPFGGQ